MTPKFALKYAALAAAMLLGGSVVMRLVQGDAGVGREIFSGLVNGRQSVHSRIDWEHLKALDVDVGATYTALPDEQQQEAYRTAFIERFSREFQSTGASLKDFSGWRLQERQDDQTIVAVDYPKKQKTLLLAVSDGGTKKLTGIQWQ